LFIYLFIYLFAYVFIYLLIYLFIYSYIYLFIFTTLSFCTQRKIVTRTPAICAALRIHDSISCEVLMTSLIIIHDKAMICGYLTLL